jgi:hypothetical protein
MSEEFVPHADWPFPKTAEDLEKNILRDEIERLTKALHYEQHLLSRIGTHGPGCWEWGPAHYECALRKIKEGNNE